MNLTPRAWLVPALITFKDAIKTNVPQHIQEAMEGTVNWTLSFIGDTPSVTDRYGVIYHPKPLYLEQDNQTPPIRSAVQARADRLKKQGHGWVVPNANGTVAKCGGPSLCRTCQEEQDTIISNRIINELEFK